MNVSRNYSSFAAIASVLLAAGAVPAAAHAEAGKSAQGSTEMGAVKTEGKGGTAAASSKTKYCYVFNITGSILPKKSCKTRAQWEAMGVDITKM